MQQSVFYQQGPVLPRYLMEDSLLAQSIAACLPAEIFAEAQPELQRFADRVYHEVSHLGLTAEAQPPQHIPFDAWGRKIDHIATSPAWDDLAAFAATEGLVALAYERSRGEHSRVLQFAKLFMFHADSAFFSCPLAMTDGAARALEIYGDANLKRRYFKRLTTRNPAEFWTSGQWMTERTGGSDVSGTSTIARPGANGSFALYGTKWFTSATTSQMAMALARIDGDAASSKGLSLFCIELRDAQGQLQSIDVHRLKDKLGTRALPTAEISLNGTPAFLVGGPQNGVKKIASMMNITRLHNSVCALSATMRALDLAKDYSHRRRAFGKNLMDLPLHRATLDAMFLDLEAWLKALFRLVTLLGKEETGSASEMETATLRVMTPVIKAITAKLCVSITSEALESFGGAGYIEDTGIPKLLRDAQVFSIWEGTTNVLALDLLRSFEKENALLTFANHIRDCLQNDADNFVVESAAAIHLANDRLVEFVTHLQNTSAELLAQHARAILFATGRIFAATNLILSAAKDPTEARRARARLWCRRELTKVLAELTEEDA